MTDRRPALQVWRVPLLIGLVSAGGLLFALLGDGPADGLSWVALTIPVVVSIWILWPSRDRGSGTP